LPHALGRKYVPAIVESDDHLLRLVYVVAYDRTVDLVLRVVMEANPNSLVQTVTLRRELIMRNVLMSTHYLPHPFFLHSQG
jgi:hypothetical protein